MNNDAFLKAPIVSIDPTTVAHIRSLCKNIRENDRLEIEGFGMTVPAGVWRSYRYGLMNKTLLVDGKVAACFGVGGSYMGTIGQPWLFTTSAVKNISSLKFVRLYQSQMKEMLDIFPNLSNYVAADYSSAIRLLSMCGFKIGVPEKINNGMYRKFEI